MKKKFPNQTAELIDVIRAGAQSISSAMHRSSVGVASLTDTELASETIVEAVGIPLYVDDVADYAAWGLTETGWYVFARITPGNGVDVTEQTSATGCAGYIVGENWIDVAVRFDVAATSRKVVIDWGASTDEFIFKATDLAVRNLDYRVTFYVYDVSDFVTWEYAATGDDAFAENKKYYTESGGEYTLAEVTAGQPAKYYERSVSYSLTADETFDGAKTYYTESGGEYTEATVTAGETVPANTYYEQAISYSQTADTAFDGAKTYYTKSGDAYTAAEVTPLDPIVTYYNHSKAIFSGMSRNITYQLDEMIDCPVEIVCPAIPEDGYGAWFEIQTRMDGAYSVTLTLPEGVTAGTTTTQAFAAGLNVIDLHYVSVAGAKSWQLINTCTKLS